MKNWCVTVAALAAFGCTGTSADGGASSEPTGFEPPVVTNPNPPVEYPLSMFNRRVEGTVVLRLFVDSTGTIVPESTRVAEGSGHAALDSAALGGVLEMRFAPALQDGRPVAAAFLQPVHFRHPDRVSAGGQ